MAARATMAALITETRLLINDPNPNPGVTVTIFSDQQVQDHLDETRFDVRYEQLTPAPSVINPMQSAQGGQIDFADYYSKYQWWESDIILQSGSFLTLTPAVSDYIVGHWQFQATPFTTGTAPGQYPPVFATGKAYDINLAAKNLWTFRAALLATAYDFTADSATFHRSQQMAACLKMADYYACKALPRSLTVTRDDLMRVSHVNEVPILGSNRDLISGR